MESVASNYHGLVVLIQSLGVPVSILAAMGYAIFRAANFLGPKITDVTEAHLRLVDTLEKQLLVQTNLINSQSAILQEHAVILKDIHRTLTADHRQAQDGLSRMDAMA